MDSEQKTIDQDAHQAKIHSPLWWQMAAIQGVYTGPELADADVEILDLDDAKVADDAEWHAVSRRAAEVEQQCLKIY